MLTITELKTKWNKEKTSYAKKEVGDGVQKFVKDILKSSEVFDLKEGLNSTKLENRKNEFKEEEARRESRHADVVIFVNPEIVIPMEIEKYQCIKDGEQQILQYQLDWNEHSNRKYGILTDGYSWRFYYNNEYREFSLMDIFDDTETFLEFWHEYIKPEAYYLAFFEKKGQRSLLKEVEILHVEDYRQIFFEDITKLIRSFKNKLKIEGYLEKQKVKDKDKIAVEITYAYIIQFILYKTLVDNEFGEYKKEFNDVQKAIYDCLKVKQYGKILDIIGGISYQISENIYRPFVKEQKFIDNTILKLTHKPRNELHEVSPWLDIFVFIKKYNFANVRNEIFGYIYENYLKELYEETKKGQYFTDPAVVNFMLEQVGYTPERIEKRLKNNPEDEYLSIIDPACGSGTFLYSAVNQIIKAVPNGSEGSSEKIEELINDNIFGLDIAEFPLYLAEMNILMRMLPLIINEKYNNPIDKKIKVFKTNDSIAEFMDTAIRNTLSDIDIAYKKNQGQASLFSEKLNLGYSSYVRDESDLEEMKKSLEKQPRCPRRRFDFVIGNPPYVSFKECSKQNVLFFELMKKRELKMSDIYGVNLHSTPDNPKKYAPNPNLYAFFIALGLALLKDNGKICFIIPQTILTAGDLDVLRYHLSKFTTIEKIITFSGKMFIGRGLKQNKPVATSSLIFVTKRCIPAPEHQIEITHYKDPNDDIERYLKNILENKKINKKKILQIKLLQNVINWNFLKQDRKFLDFYETYKNNTGDISIYYNHVLSEHNLKSRFYFDRGLKYPKDKIHDVSKVDVKDFYYVVKSSKNNFRIFRNNKIIYSDLLDFPFGSQGEVVYRQKYKIIWGYINYDKFRYTDDKIMIDYNSVLITSNNKEEILYLFALLNSNISIKIFNCLLRNENEKDILIGIKTIKEFIRIPRITENNQFIKKEIIDRTEEMLALKEIQLSNLVDLSNVMMQKFDNVSVEGDYLILEKDKKQTRLKIKDNRELIERSVKSARKDNKLKLDDKEQISLSELKDLPVIDFEKQRKIKNYIDDLVFALYFNIQLKYVDFSRANEIKAECSQNKYYELLNENGEKAKT